MRPWTGNLSFVLRALARSPRLGVAAVLCIAIGIAAMVATVTLAHAALMRSLPYPDAEHLVRLWTSVAQGNSRAGVSIPDFVEIERSGAFEVLVATARERFVFLGDDRVERMRGEAVSDGYFAVTGVQPQLGRAFNAEEMAPAGPPAIIISEPVWQRWFGGSPEVVGRVLRVNAQRGDDSEEAFTVVGVMPRGFVGTVEDDSVDFWIPLAQYGTPAIHENRSARVLWAIGRLAPAATQHEVQQRLTAIGHALAEQYPDANRDAAPWIEPIGENWRAGLRGGLYALLWGALLLLVIGCINVANLLLARLAERVRELAVRSSLGATRGSIVRLLLTESLVLAFAGGVAGLLLSWWIVRGFARYSAVRMPGWLDISIDPVVVVFAAVLMMVTAVAFGTLPALRAARLAPVQSLREGGRGSIGHAPRSLVGSALVLTQIALTAMLLIGGGLLGRSYLALATAELGYRTDHLLRMAVTVDPRDHTGAYGLGRFYDRLVESVEAEPGVARAGLIWPTVQPWSGFRPQIAVMGDDGEEATLRVHGHAIDGGFFGTMDMTMLRGRMFGPSDRAGTEPVAIVSRSLAQMLAPNGEALGRRLRLDEIEYTVVGIAADVMFDSALAPTASQWRTEARPVHDVYWSLHQRAPQLVSIAIQAQGDPRALVAPLTERVRQLAPRSAVHWVTTMDESLGERYAEARLFMLLAGGFAIAALLLATVGLYALLSHLVARRGAEIGLRKALGARGRDIARSVALRGLALAGLGAALGVLVAAAVTPLLGGLLHDIAPFDLNVYGFAAAFLVLIAAIASLLPAHRAARVDPMTALREE